MQSESILIEGHPRNTRLILFIFIILILIVFLFGAHAPWVFFVMLFVIMMFFLTMLFWQHFAFPDLGISDHINLFKIILMDQLTRSSKILSIKNGEIEGDYLLLKNKPDIKVLNIDTKSAVLVEDTSNHRALLFEGVHLFSKNPKIVAVFYLGIRCLQIGPRDKSDLGTKHSNESFAEFHLRKENVDRTRTRLTSGEYIYPSFFIFYRIAPKMEVERFQEIFEEIGNGDSEIFSFEKIDEFIINHLLNKWKAFCENKSHGEILAEFPDSFESSSINEIGIISRITLDQIY